jgi:hypothetical protein
MAWNKYYIFIKPAPVASIDDILLSLKLHDYKPVGKVPLEATNNPNTLFAGVYNGNLLLVHPDLPFEFFHDQPSAKEQLFINCFPGSEIAVLIENSTTGLFAYAIIDKGKKVRMKDGADGTIYHDEGALLPEEIAIAKEKIFSDEDLEEMKADGMSQNEIDHMVAFEASWRIPGRLTRRYLGETVSTIYPGNVMLMRYEK